MTQSLELLTHNDYVNVIEKNLFDYSAYIGGLRGGQINDSPNLKWVLTNDLIFNRVLQTRFNGNVTGRVEEMVSWLKERKLPLTWFTTPSSQPPNLDQHLTANGFTHQGHWFGMAYDVARPFATAKLPKSEVYITKVRDRKSLKTWLGVAAKSFGFSLHIRYLYQQAFYRFPLGDKGAWEFYIAHLNGKPVATGSLFHGEDGTAGIYWMATLPEYRRMGIATQIAVHLTEEARRRDQRIVVLHATKAGHPVYKQVGFTDFCNVNIYTWKPHLPLMTLSKQLVRASASWTQKLSKPLDAKPDFSGFNLAREDFRKE